MFFLELCVNVHKAQRGIRLREHFRFVGVEHLKTRGPMASPNENVDWRFGGFGIWWSSVKATQRDR